MPEKQIKTKITVVAMMAVVVSLLHYFTEMRQVYYHIFYRELYFLPLILSGFWFGLKGGLITSAGITVLYFPFVLMHWQGFSPEDFDRVLEILLFNIVAVGLGFISDRRKAEEKARMQAEHTAREQAESVSRLKSDFLSIVSHELRTPLISIVGYNDLLLDGIAGKLTEDQIDALQKIDKNSKKLIELINSLLDISRLEAQPAERKEINVSNLIDEVKTETMDLCELSGLDFVWKVEPGLPSLRTDPAKLKIVIKNLISNAAKFTEKGKVVIDAHKKDGSVEIDVTDTGEGISPEALQFIFEPFRQAESALTRRHGGAGMGLYVAKRLVEVLGGTVNVESETGRGSTFQVQIPAGNT
jgi:two-component system, NtrC family, sensor histidine kinase HydH